MAKVIAAMAGSGSGPGRRSTAVGAMLILAAGVLSTVPAVPQPATDNPPPTLRETGLYADPGTLQVDPAHLAFAPQYPLWSDGAAKRRWISLPPGTAIDGSDPEAWIFPAGTRFWKEFSFNGKKVETRYLERRADGQWLYAAYAWSADGREAQLVPARGKRGAYPLAGGRSHTIPGVADCKACHQGGPSEVLGFGTLQLSPDRDAGAPHAEIRPDPGVDLSYLVDRGLLVGLPEAVLDTPPRIAGATATERAALGYMHGNCGHCHNERGSLQNIGLFLRHSVKTAGEPAIATTVGQFVKKPAPGQSPDAVLRVVPGHPERSGLMERVSSRYSALQMPPLGTELIDDEAVRLLYRWIAENDASIQQAHANEEGR
jgi:mono/diheme cytochrome c family protein